MCLLYVYVAVFRLCRSRSTLQDYLKDTKACLTNDFSRYKRALTSVRQELPDADSLAQVRKQEEGRKEGDAAFFRIILSDSAFLVFGGVQ